MIKVKSTLGPAGYVGGGFTVPFGEFEQVNRAIAKCDRDAVLGVNDIIYSIVTTIATNIVTIQVFAATTLGVGPNNWAELGAGAMNGRTFTVIAEGE